MLTTQIGIILSGLLVTAAAVQWVIVKRHQTRKGQLLDVVEEISREEQERLQEERRLKQEEDELQAARSFGLDFMITHGTSFGGCAATCQDGRRRRGSVDLDQIMMYGRQASGKDYTYYIEDQDLMICASDAPDCLMVRAREIPFEIRQAGLSRDQGVSTRQAMIQRDILYYIILESHHEISIRATRMC